MSGDVYDYTLSFVFATGMRTEHFEIVRFLDENEYSFDKKKIAEVRFCTEIGDLEIVKWVCARHFAVGPVCWIDEAAAAGHLHIIKWVHEDIYGVTCSARAFNGASKNGHFEILAWLHANRMKGCSRSAGTSLPAADTLKS